MRKISAEAASALYARQRYNKGNTMVTVDGYGFASMWLHGNRIAAYTGDCITISWGDYEPSNTTAARLNAIFQVFGINMFVTYGKGGLLDMREYGDNLIVPFTREHIVEINLVEKKCWVEQGELLPNMIITHTED